MLAAAIAMGPPPASLADRAYLALRDRLVLLAIRPGEPIDDDELATELGMGRTPVREALKRLEQDRLVVSFPRRGTFAASLDVADLAHISEIRVQLEPLAARKAAERASAESLAAIVELADLTEQLDVEGTDRSEVMRWDLTVHRAIYRAANNPHLENVLIRYDNLVTRIHCVFLDRLKTTDLNVVAEHVALLRAIAHAEVDRAGALALEHVLGFERAIRAVI